MSRGQAQQQGPPLSYLLASFSAVSFVDRLVDNGRLVEARTPRARDLLVKCQHHHVDVGVGGSGSAACVGGIVGGRVVSARGVVSNGDSSDCCGDHVRSAAGGRFLFARVVSRVGGALAVRFPLPAGSHEPPLSASVRP